MATPDDAIQKSAVQLWWEKFMRPDQPLTLLSGGRRCVPVTKSDTVDIQRAGQNAVCRALYVSGGTQITLTLADDDPSLGIGTTGGPQVFPLSGSPTLFPFHVRRVHATTTDATTTIAIF